MDYSILIRLDRIYSQPYFREFLEALKQADIEEMKALIKLEPSILNAEQDRGGNWLFTALEYNIFTPRHVEVFKFLHEEMKQPLTVFGEYDTGMVAGNILHKFFILASDRDTYTQHIESKKELLAYILQKLDAHTNMPEMSLSYHEKNQYMSVLDSLWTAQNSVLQYCLPIVLQYRREEYMQVLKEQSFNYLEIGQYNPFYFRVLNGYHAQGNFELFEQLHPEFIDWQARNRSGENIAFHAVGAHHIHYTIPIVFERLKQHKLTHFLYERNHKGDTILLSLMVHLNLTPAKEVPALLEYIRANVSHIGEMLHYKNDKGFVLAEHIWGRGRRNLDAQQFFQSFLDEEKVTKIDLNKLES